MQGGDCPNLTESPCQPRYELPRAFGCRAPMSRLLNLMPPALGAVQANRLPGQQVIRTGPGFVTPQNAGEVARMIERGVR